MTSPHDDDGVDPPQGPQAFVAGATKRDRLDDPRYRAYHVFTLLAIPLLQLAANPNVFVNPGGNVFIDPWVYTGLFLSLPTHFHRFGDTYYASRLSWLVPGFAVHKLFPPLIANYALHLTFFYALLVTTYMLVTRGANRSAAMLVALIVASQPTILAAIGWDYIDGAGVVFLVATLLCLERAHADRATVMWAIAAGMAAACLIVTNLTLVALLPACGMFFLCRVGWRWRSVALTVVAGTLGAAAMLVGFSLVSRSLGGRWLFLEPSVRFSLAFYGALNPYKADGFVWGRATWLALPVFVSIGAVLSLIVPVRGQSPFGRTLQSTFLVAVATWVLSDLVGNSALLRYSYYMSYLAPLALIALPLQAATPPPNCRLRAVVALELLTLTTLAVADLVFVFDGGRFVNRCLTWLGWVQANEHAVVTTLAATIAGCVGVLSLRFVRSTRLSWPIFLVGIACSYVALPPLWLIPGIDARAEFEETAGAHRFITRHVDSRPVRFWSSAATRSSPPFRSVSSTYLWGWVLINEELPVLTRSQAATLQPGTRLVLLLERQAEADAARAALREFGFDYAVVAEDQFGRGSRTFRVVIADLVQRHQA